MLFEEAEPTTPGDSPDLEHRCREVICVYCIIYINMSVRSMHIYIYKEHMS